MERKGSAVWHGTLKEGKGEVSSQSGLIKSAPYSFGTRFGDTPGTNPEELIGAAHAACFSMALSAVLASKGMTPISVSTTATVTVQPVEGGFGITGIHLDTVGKIEGGDAAAFEEAAKGAKAGCPVSKALASVPITLTATLEA